MVGENVVVKYKQLSNPEALAVFKKLREAIPGDARYWLNRNIQSIVKSLKPIEEKRRDLIKQYGILNKEKNEYSVNPNDENFKKHFGALLETDVLILINKIPISKIACLNLTEQEMHLVDFLFCEDKKIIITSSSTIQ